MTPDDLRALALDANIRAFLRVIRAGESSQRDDAYTILFGGGHFSGFAAHPDQLVTKGAYSSTAAGAYQFLFKTWSGLVAQYHFPDFGPESQDLGAIALLAGRDAIDDIQRGDLDAALPKAGKEWASMPGSPYGQPTITAAHAKAVFVQYGGIPLPVAGVSPQEPLLAMATPIAATDTPAVPAPPAPSKGPFAMPIAALIATFGPMIADLIPQVAKLFGSGTEVATRNTAAASIVLDTVVKAANAANVQQAVENMQNDPALAARVRQAVITDPTIMGLLEVGGGVAEARRVAAEPAQIPFWKNPAWVVTAMCLPLVYLVVVAVIFDLGHEWSDEMRSVVVTAIVTGLLGSVSGFFLGSSYGSMKKTEAAIDASPMTPK